MSESAIAEQSADARPEQPLARTPQRRGPVRRWAGSARVRILVLMLVMMTGALAITGAVLYSIQLAALTERVNAELRQERDEIDKLGKGDPERGIGAYNDPEVLIADFLSQSVPGTHEAWMGIINGQVALVGPQEDEDADFDITAPELVTAAIAAAEPGEAVFRDIQTAGTEVRMIIVDVQIEGQPTQALFVVAIDIETQRREIYASMSTYAALSGGALLIAAITGYLLTGRLMRPLADLRAATNAIDPADLTRRVSVREPDNDVAQLAVNFNQMLDRLQTGFADQRQFLDDAAHELRTPLTILRGNLETLDPTDAEDVGQTRALAVGEVDRMDRLVADLLLLAKSRRPDFLRAERVDVEELTAEAYARIRLLGDRDWRLSAGAAGSVVADRQRLLQAIAQLSANAVRFSSVGDRIELGVRWANWTVAGAESRRYLVIAVQDTGIGIDTDHLAGLFDRFRRAPNSGSEGLGLGLPIVRAIVTGHGGTVTVESEPGNGSTFEMWIPGGEEWREY